MSSSGDTLLLGVPISPGQSLELVSLTLSMLSTLSLLLKTRMGEESSEVPWPCGTVNLLSVKV